jgi:hypothetical protein
MRKMTMMLIGGTVASMVGGLMVFDEQDAEASIGATTQPTITVRSRIDQTTNPPTVEVTVEGSGNVQCTNFCCTAPATTSTVSLSFDPNSGQFLYVLNSFGTVTTSLPGSVPNPGSVDFSVVGASTQSGSKELYWGDPKIIVQTSTCGGARP